MHSGRAKLSAMAAAEEKAPSPPKESDRLARIARLFERALELFDGNVDAAGTWLVTQQPALDDLAPVELAKTEVGTIEVEMLIGRIELGLPA
jgi:putative toxin-antitoxin system antitoxin component (TIGR02293 family)